MTRGLIPIHKEFTGNTDQSLTDKRGQQSQSLHSNTWISKSHQQSHQQHKKHLGQDYSIYPSQPTDHGQKLNHLSSTHKQKEREKLKDKLKDLLEDPTATPDDVFKTMMTQLSKEEQGKIEKMQNKGMSKEAIIKHFLSGGLDAVDKGHSQPSDHGQIRP